MANVFDTREVRIRIGELVTLNEALQARLAEAERLLRLAYGAVGTLRRISVSEKDRLSAASYEGWQREADAWLLRPADSASVERVCIRCDKSMPDGCKGAQHGNKGCAMNNPETLACTTTTRCAHDGARCHHECDTECSRAKMGASLSSPWPGYPKKSPGQ